MTNTGELNESLKAVAKGAGIIFIGFIVGKILALGNQIILARFLGADKYGLFSLGLSVITIASIISISGVGFGVTRFISYYRGKNRDDKVRGTIWFGLKFTLILSAIFAIVLFLFSDQISTGIFKEPRFEKVLQLFLLALPLMVLTNILIASFRGFKEAKYSVYVEELAIRLIRISVFLIFVYLGYLLYGAIIAFIMGYFLAMVISFFFIQRKTFPIFRLDINPSPIGREILSFSWPLMLTLISGIFIAQTDRILIGVFKTSEYVGIYSAAYGIAILLTFASSALAFIFLPSMSELISEGKMSVFSRLYKSTTKWIFLITFPPFLFIIIFSREIMGLLYGLEYIAGATVLMVLASGFMARELGGLTWDTLVAAGKTRLILFADSSTAVINVILNIILIPPFGIEGAAIATACSLIIGSVLRVSFVCRLIKIQPYNKQYIKILLASAPIALIAIVTRFFVDKMLYWHLLIILPFYLGIYLLLLIKFRCLEEDDKTVLNAIQKRLGIKSKFFDFLL